MTVSLKEVTQIIFSFSVLIVVIASCDSGSQKVNISKSIDAVKKYHQVWSNGNIEEFDKFIAPNFTSHYIGGLSIFTKQTLYRYTNTNENNKII
ncbi:MAG: hypothetical protein R2796_07160 [Chitinophagaceae bacterium]